MLFRYTDNSYQVPQDVLYAQEKEIRRQDIVFIRVTKASAITVVSDALVKKFKLELDKINIDK